MSQSHSEALIGNRLPQDGRSASIFHIAFVLSLQCRGLVRKLQKSTLTSDRNTQSRPALKKSPRDPDAPGEELDKSGYSMGTIGIEYRGRDGVLCGHRL